MDKITIDSALTRWMCFVDGDNFLIRGERLAKDSGVELISSPFYLSDAFLWVPEDTPVQLILRGRKYGSYHHPIRSYYYRSLAGDLINSVQEEVRHLGFEPRLFKKPAKATKSKQVDIALATDILGHAFRGNYDVAFLFSGDEDYVPLVEEIKRLGKVVYLVFFASAGLSRTLRLAADAFLPIDRDFLRLWDNYSYPRQGQRTIKTPDFGSITAHLRGRRSLIEDEPEIYDRLSFETGSEAWSIKFEDATPVGEIPEPQLIELFERARGDDGHHTKFE